MTSSQVKSAFDSILERMCPEERARFEARERILSKWWASEEVKSRIKLIMATVQAEVSDWDTNFARIGERYPRSVDDIYRLAYRSGINEEFLGQNLGELKPGDLLPRIKGSLQRLADGQCRSSSTSNKRRDTTQDDHFGNDTKDELERFDKLAEISKEFRVDGCWEGDVLTVVKAAAVLGISDTRLSKEPWMHRNRVKFGRKYVYKWEDVQKLKKQLDDSKKPES